MAIHALTTLAIPKTGVYLQPIQILAMTAFSAMEQTRAAEEAAAHMQATPALVQTAILTVLKFAMRLLLLVLVMTLPVQVAMMVYFVPQRMNATGKAIAQAAATHASAVSRVMSKLCAV